MKGKKTLALMLAGLLGVATLAGCRRNDGEEVDPDTTTIIYVTNNDGGFGTDWLREAAVRFQEAYADHSFAEGKTGVYVDVEGTREERLSTMSTSAINIYFYEQSSEVRDLAQGGTLLEINDVLTEKYDTRDGQAVSIEDKIPEENRIALKGRDGNYYGLPHFEYVPGLSYDKDLFIAKNLYFADDSETNVQPFTSSYGSVNFVGSKDAKKHCGNDGIYGTSDDGLPTSLQDMLILCAKMKQLGISPFTFPGMYKTYANLLQLSLWASLAGYDEMRVNYTFDGPMEVITGWTDEPLFQGTGLSSIKKPITETITITEETGYKIYDSAARYYALAFLQAVQSLGWFSQDSETSTVSHTDAQGKFIYGGTYTNPQIGMIIEGNYWWNETEEKAANVSTFLEDTGKTERNIDWMSLPTSVNGARPTEGTANEVAFVEIGASYCVVNANIKGNTELVDACKAFLKFLYSDTELELFTKSVGVNRSLIEYPVQESTYAGFDNYTKSFQNVVKRADNAKVVYAVADNATYLASPATFKIKKGNTPVTTVIYGGKTYESYLEAMKNSVSLRNIYEATRFDTSDWATYYQG